MLRRLFGKREEPPRDRWDLSMPLLNWSKGDIWTLRDAVEGLIILGATGAGKSSSSGRTIARSMLEAGFGGLVLTAKADERAQWEFYCHQARRSEDLLIFGPQELLRFNFLDYELNRKGSGAGQTENIVNLFSMVLEVADRNSSGGGGRDGESYWRRSARQLLRNICDLLAIARGRISVPDMYRVCVTAATSNEMLKSESWKASSFCYQLLQEADKKPKTEQQQQDFRMVADYLLLEFPSLADKTRSVIVSTFTSAADVLLRGSLRTLFCNETNVTPEGLALALSSAPRFTPQLATESACDRKML